MSDKLQTGDAIPSMRALAKAIHVSVITVQKAYEDLQRDGFIETTVGRENFVAAKNKEFYQEEQQRIAEEHLQVAAEIGRMRLMVEEKIQQMFLKYPNIIYGFTSISYSLYASQYKSALVFAVPYGVQLTIENYTEEKFEKGIQDAKEVLEEILMQIEKILNAYKVKYYIPPVAQNNEEELAAPFSFKYAAVNAGLGWIGKNDVVVTEKYGPRVRLSAILIDNPFTYGQRIIKSNCLDSCKKCVEICPYNALHDVKWDIDALRNDIIDYKLCNQKRSLYIEKHGRKNACGLCMAACPIGV